MKLSAILLARVLGYVEVFDLIPKGEIYFPDVVREIVAKYQFQKFPQTLEEHDTAKGVEFLEGKSGKRTIQKFVIWNNLLVLETRSNTNDSKAILEEMLLWARDRFGISYASGVIKRYAYISDLTFQSDADLLIANTALANIADRVTSALTQIWQEPVRYTAVSLKVGHDPTARKYSIAPFVIERRAEARFSENKYFSEAPVPTDLHLELLEQFEREMLHGSRV